MSKKKNSLFDGRNVNKSSKIKLPTIKSIDKLLWGEIRRERRNVPQSVKTEVYARANGKCEYPRCGTKLKKSEGEFHHWRDPATERNTAFLCHKHHVNYGHKYKTETDILGKKTIRITIRKRIPIKIKKTTSKTKPKTKPKKRRKNTVADRLPTIKGDLDL